MPIDYQEVAEEAKKGKGFGVITSFTMNAVNLDGAIALDLIEVGTKLDVHTLHEMADVLVDAYKLKYADVAAHTSVILPDETSQSHRDPEKITIKAVDRDKTENLITAARRLLIIAAETGVESEIQAAEGYLAGAYHKGTNVTKGIDPETASEYAERDRIIIIQELRNPAKKPSRTGAGSAEHALRVVQQKMPGD